MSQSNLALSAPEAEALLTLPSVLEGSEAGMSPSTADARQLAFVDAGLAHIDTLIQGLENTKVVLIDRGQDGISQITQTLTQYQNLDSVHIFSHGTNGTLQLGDAVLGGGTISHYQSQLRQWRSAFSEQADLMLYGCNLAAGAASLTLLDQINELTGADVAASHDLTGQNVLGGNWALEVSVGQLETAVLLDEATQATYAGLLASAPVITSDGGSAERASISVNEGTALVTTVTATDPDGDTAGNGLSFSISGGPDADDFVIDADTGLLQFVSEPDFEAPTDRNTNNYYAFSVSVTDSDGLSDEQDILVAVQDSPEGGAPVITSDGGSAERASISVNEGTASVTTVTATDPDGDTAGNGLSFSISGGPDADDFVIDADTGLLQFVSEPDFEAPTDSNTNNYYAFSVSVTDSDGLSDEQDILVAVQDGPEGSAPVITSNGGSATRASIAVNEGTQQVTTVTATDPDGDTPGNGLSFSISGGPDADDFVIDADTGLLQFVSEPDFEAPTDSNTNNYYAFKVSATDSNGLSDTQDILLQVLDVPDDDSVFALQSNDTILVNEAAGNATVTAVRTGNAQSRVTVEYTLNETSGPDSAQANVDYTEPTFAGRPNTGQIVFEAGQTEATFTIPIINDTAFETNESFAIGLQNPSAGTLGAPRTALFTIVDDDVPAELSISTTDVSVGEGAATASVTVQRSGDITGTASVEFTTGNGTAIAGSDYTATSGILTFTAGQTSQTIDVPIRDDIAVENNETFSVTLSNPTGAALGSQTTSTITILDNDLELGNLIRTTAVSGLIQPTTLDWTPDGRYLLVAEKSGVVKVVDNGTLRSTLLVDLSAQVNDTRDRGLLGLAIHPDFPNTPYVYLLHTYDPPETLGRTNLGGADGNGNRPSRMVRLIVDPDTMIADPASLTVLAGTNSTWEYTSAPTDNSTGNTAILPSGIVNGTTITAPVDQIDVGTQDNDPDRPGIQNQNIRDYLASDSESHSIGDLEFGPDGYLYLSNGDGTSYNFLDPRTVRVQDVQNLSGKVLRIDPITGEGVATNPFFNGDADSNQSKVFYSGLRNPFRFAFDPVTELPMVGDVGWFSFEEINTGPAGSNFGWPYLEGPSPTPEYQNLSQAIAFYNNGNRNNPGDTAAIFPILSRDHGAPDNARAIMLGDFYNSNTLMFGDINNGTLYAATLDNNRQVTNIQVFDSNIEFVVDIKRGPDGSLYGVNLVSGTILRWEATDPNPQPNLTATFNNFSDVSTLNLNGSAANPSDRLRLTSASGSQAGSAFLEQALQVSANTDFSTQFQFQLTGGQGTNGADGFTFMLQNTLPGVNALGETGGFLGYSGINNSLAIEFDTYRNFDFSGDPNSNHVSVLRDGNLTTALSTANSPFDLNGGNVLTAWVDYNGATNALQLYLSNTSVKPLDALLDFSVDLADVLGDTAYVGFSAGTGGLVNNHDILNWSFSSND
ncbi:MAG: DUF4347 domain-containing protein [Cyanobacteria bacterium J06627_3]